LTNAQLELLKLFSRDVPEEDLIELKQLIVNYLAEKLGQKADEIWEEKGWTNEDMKRMSREHIRTLYKN